MVASVPELTKRIFSMEGKRRFTASASSTSPGQGAPKEVDRPAASVTARTTSGWACPRIRGPQLHT